MSVLLILLSTWQVAAEMANCQRILRLFVFLFGHIKMPITCCYMPILLAKRRLVIISYLPLIITSFSFKEISI
jgi:hypothetical protein